MFFLTSPQVIDGKMVQSHALVGSTVTLHLTQPVSRLRSVCEIRIFSPGLVGLFQPVCFPPTVQKMHAGLVTGVSKHCLCPATDWHGVLVACASWNRLRTLDNPVFGKQPDSCLQCKHKHVLTYIAQSFY